MDDGRVPGRRAALAYAGGSLLLAGCPSPPPAPVPPTPAQPTGLVLPDVTPATALPQFAAQVNEVLIADSFNDVHPTLVIGALVNIDTGKVYALDGFLKKDAKPTVTPQTDVVFRNFIENGITAQAEWLSFVKANVNDTTRAEVTVTKSAKVSIEGEQIDKALLIKRLSEQKIEPRDDFGVIVGYTAYVLSAQYFRSSGADAALSGYGAKIGGTWFSKSENSATEHRIVAVWAPLPFVIESAAKAVAESLPTATIKATSQGKLILKKLPIKNLKLF